MEVSQLPPGWDRSEPSLGPPLFEHPGRVGANLEAFRGRDIVVGISDILGFSTGVRFDVRVWIRRREGGFAVQAEADRYLKEDAGLLRRHLRFGARYEDGREVWNTPGIGEGSLDRPAPVLLLHEARAEQMGLSVVYWLWPYPSSGGVVVMVEWPEKAVPRGSVIVAGHKLQEARRKARGVWVD